MTDIAGEAGTLTDLLLDTVPTVLMAIITLIIGYILAYVAGEMVRELLSHHGRDRATGISGLNRSVVAGKIAKALVFAIGAIMAIQMLVRDEIFGDMGIGAPDYLIRLVLGMLIIFVGGFVADITSAAVARWLHGGSCVSEETDPTRELVLLGLLLSMVLMGLGVMLMESLVVLIIFTAFLVIGVTLILLEARRKICRKP